MRIRNNNTVVIGIANAWHSQFAGQISALIEDAAKVRGTGIAKRSEEYLVKKIVEGKAVIALAGKQLAGFCYIETWGHDQFIANSGLIVHNDFRGMGLGKKIKEKTFQLAREKYPQAKIFGITTSLAVMKINSALGYEPVTFSELTNDDQFWKGCAGCVNYDILNRTNHHHCLCTGMLFDPAKKKNKIKKSTKERWDRFSRFIKKYRSYYQNGKKKLESEKKLSVQVEKSKNSKQEK